MAPTRCACGESVGNHDCLGALKDKVKRLEQSAGQQAWETARHLQFKAEATLKRVLDALHAHHNNDESPANCAACRKVLAP